MKIAAARCFASLVAGFALALGGCAGTSPVQPLTDATARLESNGFSVMPPKGADWFVEVSPYGVAFYKKLRPDTHVTPAGAAVAVPRTFFVLVTLVRRGNVDVSSPEALRKETERFLRDEPGPNRRLVEYKAAPYSAQGTDCVRYEARYEERDRPFAPGAVLDMPGGGFLCRHPFSTGQAIHGTFSERHVHGAPAVAGEAYRSEAQSVLDSVVFAPLR